MAVTNVTEEVNALRRDKLLHDRIDALGEARSAFALKALVLAGHVTPHVMEQALDLAETVRVEY